MKSSPRRLPILFIQLNKMHEHFKFRYLVIRLKLYYIDVLVCPTSGHTTAIKVCIKLPHHR
ncbi:hypothetical protein HanIR_Chr07g0303921 [Helianthus annuus]|nr:hypothetical protein HanIR_Chr07g0303921 [Helianthus annuus]